MKRNVEEHTLSRNTFLNLRSPGLFARWPIIGFMMFLLGSLVFGALAYNVRTNTGLLQWDIATAKTLHTDAMNIPPVLVEYVIFGFFVGREIIIMIGTILAIYFLHKHFWRELAMILIGLGGGGLIWYFLSRYFDRPRPVTQIDVVLTDPSFPSGHTVSAVLCYGLLAYLLVPKMPSRFWKWFVVSLAVLIIAFIGFSRLILGGHYVTDVVAGYAIGLAWAGLVYTLLERILPVGTVNVKESSLKRNTSEGLRTPGLFRRWPMIGFIMILLGSLSFAILGYNVLTHGSLVQLDVSLYKEILANAKAAPSRVNELMLFGFFIGKEVIQVIVTLLAIYFFYQRFWRELGMLLISSAGGSLVWRYFNVYFNRPRPPEQLALVITNPSFPSGHTMSAIICYGLLAYLLVPKMPSRFWKWALIIATLVIILFSGFSRIFEGSHYLTDVLSGYALGIAWAGLVYTLLENFFRKESQDDKKR